MDRFFNVNGDCKPGQHYMVDIRAKLDEIKKMVERGEYFTINRARQYGKTTTLRALGRFLEKEYLVISLDFQMLSHADFKDEPSFASAFSGELLDCVSDIPQEIKEKLAGFMKGTERNCTLSALFKVLSRWCGQAEKPAILLIDEVDSASNNQVFMDFLAQLRGYYINRDVKPTFQSVILAGVYDIKNIRQKIRTDEEHKNNSPWNVASDFLVDMSFVVGVRSVESALMFGFVRVSDSRVLIANRIFETLLYNYFLAVPSMQQEEIYDAALKEKALFIEDRHLNMKMILERFVLHFDDLYGDRGQKFYEDDGRRYFMLFLKPIINGAGNCYVEAETRNRKRSG